MASRNRVHGPAGWLGGDKSEWPLTDAVLNTERLGRVRESDPGGAARGRRAASHRTGFGSVVATRCCPGSPAFVEDPKRSVKTVHGDGQLRLVEACGQALHLVAGSTERSPTPTGDVDQIGDDEVGLRLAKCGGDGAVHHPVDDIRTAPIPNRCELAS